MGKKYVCTGAILSCPFGTAKSTLTATPKLVSLCLRDQANILDFQSKTNIAPFGLCKSLGYPPTAAATAANHGRLTPTPCVPGTSTPWIPIDPMSLLAGAPALLSPSTCVCKYGGTISIVMPGQILEETGAEKVEITTKDANIQRMFWTDDDGNEADFDSVDAKSNHSLCLQTSLPPGSQLVVNIGGNDYHTVVGNGSVAKIENVDVDEISWNVPMSAKKSSPKPTTPSTPSVPKTSVPKSTPADVNNINTVTIDTKTDSGWGDPVASPRIRQNRASNLFGKVRNNGTKNHQGFDYYAATGTNVMSVGDGVVEWINNANGAYGKCILIRHKRGAGNVWSFYAHLSKVHPNVKKGSVVKKGQVVAYSGTTGNANGMTGEDQHLHFEARTTGEMYPGIGLQKRENPNSIVSTKFAAGPNGTVKRI